MKFCQPSSSQSKSTQTRPSSFGSRKACDPLHPCCFRFSRLVVEKTPHERSKSSTFVVPRNTALLLCRKEPTARPALRRRRLCGAESKARVDLLVAPRPHLVLDLRLEVGCGTGAPLHSFAYPGSVWE